MKVKSYNLNLKNHLYIVKLDATNLEKGDTRTDTYTHGTKLI